MKVSFKNKTELVQYVSDRLDRLKQDYASTMIIEPGSSADSYVLTVTDISLEDLGKERDQSISKLLMNTWKLNTPVG